jgi:dTDP-glucose 4,6-dehydratase
MRIAAMKLPAADLHQILLHTQPSWERLRNGRLFLTGGTGFFGCWLLESFHEANQRFELQAEAVVLSRNPERFAQKAPHLASSPAIRLHPGDVTDFTFPEGRFTHLIHAATTSSAQVSDQEMLATLLSGTQRVLAFAERAGVDQLLLTSSGAVYGDQPPELSHLPESYPGAPELKPTPKSVYGEGKRLAELLCSIAHRDSRIQAKIARCFAFVGPHLPLDAHFAIGNFIGDALARRPIRVSGDGAPLRSYLYAADLAEWLWTILFTGEPVRPYNVGSPHPISIADLARTIGSMFDVPVEITNAPTPGVLPPRYVPGTHRAETELNLRVRTPLGEAIRKTAQWHRPS